MHILIIYLARRLPFYYGWVVLGTAGSSMFVRNAAGSLTFAVFVPLIAEDTGWSRALIGGAAAVGGLLATGASPPVGWAIDRFGARLVLVLSLVALGISTIALAWLSVHIAIFYAALAVGRIMFSSPLNVGAATLVGRWFVRQRGRATGLLFLSHSGGMAAFPLVATWVSAAYGWQTAWIVLGVMVYVIALAPAALLVAQRPEDVGLLPDGDRPARGASDPGSSPAPGGASDTASSPASGGASDTASSPASGAASDTASSPASGGASDTASSPASGAASDTASNPASGAASDTASSLASGAASDTASSPASGAASDPASSPASGVASDTGSSPASGAGVGTGAAVGGRQNQGATLSSAGSGSESGPGSGDGAEAQWTARQAMRTPALWVLAIGTGFLFLLQSGTNVYQADLLRSRGLDLELAQLSIAVNAAGTGLGSILWGRMVELLRVSYTYALAALVMTLGLAVFIVADTALLGFVAAGVFGIAVAGILVVPPVAYANFFGRQSLGTIRGVTEPFTSLGQAIGAVSSGLVYHFAGGSYTGAFVAYAALGALTAGALLLARPPGRLPE